MTISIITSLHKYINTSLEIIYSGADGQHKQCDVHLYGQFKGMMGNPDSQEAHMELSKVKTSGIVLKKFYLYEE